MYIQYVVVEITIIIFGGGGETSIPTVFVAMIDWWW